MKNLLLVVLMLTGLVTSVNAQTIEIQVDNNHTILLDAESISHVRALPPTYDKTIVYLKDSSVPTIQLFHAPDTNKNVATGINEAKKELNATPATNVVVLTNGVTITSFQ